MSAIVRPRQRRRAVLTCVECRKRKQKCSRGNPCMQCVARGPESVCTYDQTQILAPATAGSSSLRGHSSVPSPPSENSAALEDPDAPALLRRAHEYGYSNSDSLNSMGILMKVVTDIVGQDFSFSHPGVTSQVQSRVRSEYYGYVRRLPPKLHCDVLFQYFFINVSPLNAALDETIFREQLERWRGLSYNLLKQGPEYLPSELQLFPALIFQVLALTTQILPTNYDPRLDELRFGPSQTFADLSREYTDCGVALSKLLGRARPTLVGVQQSFLRDYWLVSSGDLMQAWNHSGETVKDAMAIGLHLEPEIPSSSQPEALLDALWINELRKRTWLNLFVWDSLMSLSLGRPMFINLKECTVMPPVDCDIPVDRLKRVPVARSDSDKPTPMTERLFRLKLSRRFCEVRELEIEGPIPRSPEKVKELHHFAVKFQKSLPAFYQTTDTDKRWDAECRYVPTHRELLSYLVDSFLMMLHRPYIFTREQSQLQVYKSSLDILDSQDRLFEAIREDQTQFYTGVTFPTFDAAVLLAVVLVSNPERYHASFSRPYQSLRSALERLTVIGSTMPLAKTGAEILQTTISRVVEAQERAGFPIYALPSDINSAQDGTLPVPEEPSQASSRSSSSMSPNLDHWQFELNQSAMDWAAQNPNFSEFDFSNLEVPMPLKELLLDEEMTALPGIDAYDPSQWISMQDQQGLENMASGQEPMLDVSENSLWNFLTGYPTMSEDQYTQ